MNRSHFDPMETRRPAGDVVADEGRALAVDGLRVASVRRARVRVATAGLTVLVSASALGAIGTTDDGDPADKIPGVNCPESASPDEKDIQECYGGPSDSMPQLPQDTTTRFAGVVHL